MKSSTIIWIVAGFALLGLSGLLESLGDTGITPGSRLTFHLPALAALGAANFCFYRGLRGALGSIWSGLWQGSARKTGARPAYRIADEENEAASDFDADAAFARYMERRATGLEAEPQQAPATPPRPALNPAARSPARPGFGRKTV